jgi:hypothetical protein
LSSLPKPASTLSGKFTSVIVCGKVSAVSPAYEQAERMLLERIFAEHKSNLPEGTRGKTMRGPNLPDSDNLVGIEGFVRVLQMRLGMDLRPYQTEHREQDGFSFMVIYIR